MKQRHLALSTLVANCHVYPCLPLCSELVNRGYRVTYPTTERYASLIRTTGAEPVIYRELPASKEVEEEYRKATLLPPNDPSWWNVTRVWFRHMHDLTRDLLRQLDQFYAANPADVVIYDRLAPAGRLLARRCGARLVQISAAFACYKNLFFRKDGVCMNPPEVTQICEELDEFYNAEGLPAEGSLWHTEDLNVHFIPRQFQYESSSFDGRYYFAGRELKRPYEPIWQNRAPRRPIILISGFSGVSNMSQPPDGHFRMVIDGLRNAPYDCVLLLGQRFDADLFGAIPENFELSAEISPLEILPHAALLICHGGIGTTLEALYHGVPVLAIPPHQFCEEVAYRLVELGLGESVYPQKTSRADIGSIANKLIADVSLRDRVRTMQAQFRNTNHGADKIVDAIEAYLS